MSSQSNISLHTYEGLATGYLLFSILIFISLILLPLPLLVEIIGFILFGFIILSTGLPILARFISLQKGDWAKVHYPMMILMARINGRLSNDNDPTMPAYDVMFRKDPVYAAQKMLREVVDDDLASKLIEQIDSRAVSDKKAIKAYMISKNPEITQAQLKEIYTDYVTVFAYENPKTYIAEVVSEKYTEKERDDYVIAVLSGRAQ